MMTLSRNSFHWRMVYEDGQAGAGVIQKACDVINALTPEQKAAIELYVKSERQDEHDSAYAEGYSDGNRDIDLE